LEVLSIYAAFRSIAALLPKVLIALGYPRFVMWNDIAAILVLGLAFVAGSHWGITGIAWGWVVGYPLVVIPLYRKAFTTIGMKLREYVAGLRPAIEGTTIMAIAVEFVKRSLPNTLPLLARLGLEIASGAVFYSVTMLLRHRERIVVFWKMAKGFRKA
jgi:O-antigen/teichoic acid export membrane protein